MINVLLGNFPVMKWIPLYTKKEQSQHAGKSKKGFPFPAESALFCVIHWIFEKLCRAVPVNPDRLIQTLRWSLSLIRKKVVITYGYNIEEKEPSLYLKSFRLKKKKKSSELTEKWMLAANTLFADDWLLQNHLHLLSSCLEHLSSLSNIYCIGDSSLHNYWITSTFLF